MLKITNPQIKFAFAEQNHRQTVPEYVSQPPFCRDGSNIALFRTAIEVKCFPEFRSFNSIFSFRNIRGTTEALNNKMLQLLLSPKLFRQIDYMFTGGPLQLLYSSLF